ncbi:MAG: cytochrome P450 [Acidimicrobiaceae bacterium]|nr:cytochrome P450 [Acidimicrobiaceae bacterium]
MSSIEVPAAETPAAEPQAPEASAAGAPAAEPQTPEAGVDSGPYYDPFDFEIDADPYPTWRRLREEAPLYRNERYDFYALSRFDDVAAAFKDWRTYSSARGTVLEIIKSGMDVPPGFMIFEDPPVHDYHRGLVSRVFTPKKMNALESKLREFCARSLDPLVGTGGFDFIADLGAQVPMRAIGMLLGIPEQDQTTLRDLVDDSLKLDDGTMPEFTYQASGDVSSIDFLREYIRWRTDNPADDLMTELLYAEFEDETGTPRRLTRSEVMNFVSLLNGAGNETTTRLIGWTGKLLAEHPDQRRDLVEDRSLIPQAIEEILRYETPSPVQARWVTSAVEHHGRTVPADSVMLLLNGAANRDDRKFGDGDTFDIHRNIDFHLAFGYGIHFCLGAALARIEGRIALDEVLKRWPDWDVDWDNAVQARTSTVRGWESLPVVTG